MIHLGKLEYFTNLNLAAIWGWFPIYKPYNSQASGEQGSVVIKFAQFFFEHEESDGILKVICMQMFISGRIL